MEMDDSRLVCRTAGDLIEALSALPADTALYAHEPPFTGVLLVLDGKKVGVHSLWNTAEGRAYRKALRPAAVAA